VSLRAMWRLLAGRLADGAGCAASLSGAGPSAPAVCCGRPIDGAGTAFAAFPAAAI